MLRLQGPMMDPWVTLQHFCLLSIFQRERFFPASEPSHLLFPGLECHPPPRSDAPSPCPGETSPSALLSQNPALFLKSLTTSYSYVFCLFITCLSPPLSHALPDIWNRISFVLRFIAHAAESPPRNYAE